MKAVVLRGLLEQGKKPFVRITGILWDDAFGNKGMIAQVVSFMEDHHDVWEFGFDYNSHRDHNLALDTSGWFLPDARAAELGRMQGTALEAGQFKDGNIKEEVYFDPGDDINVELLVENSIIHEYISSGSTLPYVEWLEAKLEELVPDCMKTWKSGE